MHPSVSTCVNSKKRINNIEDLNELTEELNDKNLYADIILSHNSIRTPDGDAIISSGLKIHKLLTIYMYILLDDFE